MAKLTLRDRFALIGSALKGQFDVKPGSVGHNFLSRMYPAVTGEPPKRGTVEFLKAYSTSPWLRAVESRIAQGLSAVPWCLYKVKAKGDEKASRDKRIQRASLTVRKGLMREREQAGELTEISDHIFLTAIDQPNPYMTGLDLRRMTSVYLDLVGECFWLKERNGAGAPIRFWPLAPDWVIDTPTPGDPSYRISIRGFQADIPSTEILYMRDPDPVNPYGRGSGQVMAVGDELDADEYAAKTQRARFANSARPEFMVFPKNGGIITEAEAKRLEIDWTNKHQGFWRAFKPRFATTEIGVHEFTQDFASLQLVELRRHERDMILQVTGGFSPELLGLIENSNRSTIDAAKYLMDTQVLIPRLEFQRAHFQQFLISDYDERLILDYDSPAQADPNMQLDAKKSAPYTLTVNEWREAQGLPPLAGKAGEVHMLPMGLTAVEKIDEPPPVEEPLDDDEVKPPAA